MHKGWYQYLPEYRGLWIVPPKCGSNSFSEYFTKTVKYEGRDVHPCHRVMIVVRHPYQRVVSALKHLGLPLITKAVLENYHDQHLRPYKEWIGGRDDVTPVRLRELAKMAGFPHLNNNGSPPWQTTGINWAEVYPIYEEDFDLCHEWSHTPEEL